MGVVEPHPCTAGAVHSRHGAAHSPLPASRVTELKPHAAPCERCSVRRQLQEAKRRKSTWIRLQSEKNAANIFLNACQLLSGCRAGLCWQSCGYCHLRTPMQ